MYLNQHGMITPEINNEIANGIIHGAVVNAGTSKETLVEQAQGYAVNDQKTKMRIDTIIDIASVTKVLATTTALLIARDEGLIDFDAPFTQYLPGYIAPLSEPLTIRDLAMHISGFRQQSYYKASEGSQTRKNLLSTPPPESRGKIKYSCWNFLLLGIILEQVTKKTLPEFCREEIFNPLCMSDTSLGYPLTKDFSRLSQSCATEKPGQISDVIAFSLYRDGLSAGNAGVFSCASDLAKFCRCILRGGEFATGKRLFSVRSFNDITTSMVCSGTLKRSFGWITADEWKPDVFSSRTIYHSGWSGQTIFIDLEKDFYAVVLTTRFLQQYEQARAGRFKIIGDLGKKYLP